jgi:DNA-binding MarR family transcriptional regulator
MSSTAQFTDRLAKHSWITRSDDKKERRIFRLTLTTSVQQELSSFNEQMIERMADFYGNIPEEDVRELLRIHKELIDKMASKNT